MRNAGLSLVELLVTMAVAGILLATAVPGYTSLIANNRLSTTANAFVATLHQARLEAVRRNTSTQFCSDAAATNGGDPLGTACGAAGGAVYVLNSDASATRIGAAPDLPSGLTLVSTAALRYSGQGLARTIGGGAPYTGLVIDVSSSQLASGNHRCVYLTTGSIASSCSYTDANDGACPASEPSSCR